jgi:hypothetical protein
MSLEGDYKWLHMLRWVRRVGWVYICGMCTRSRQCAAETEERATVGACVRVSRVLLCNCRVQTTLCALLCRIPQCAEAQSDGCVWAPLM